MPAASYTDQTGVQGHLGRELTEYEATFIKILIEAASDYVENFTGTSWSSGEDDETRLYAGGEEYLFIDPAINITAVELLNTDGSVNTTLTSDDWTAYPLNGKTITYLGWNGYRRWPRGRNNIRITGKFGEVDGIPSDIRYATTALAAKWMSKEKNLKMEDIEGYRRQFHDIATQDPEVLNILESRKRVYI